MDKIEQNLMERCNSVACCANEFIVLPADGDAGFEEYFTRKADKVYDANNLFTRKKERTKLILKYPSPMSDDSIFSRFFASPETVAGNQPFEGCFGIDVTDYLHKTTDPRLEQLIVFIKRHPDIVFVLFAYVNDAQKAMLLLKTLDQYFPLQMLQISLPDADRLTEYSENLIREFCTVIDNEITEEIRAFFAEKPMGYDTAEFLVRELKERKFCGEREILLNVLRYLKSCTGYSSIADGYGY